MIHWREISGNLVSQRPRRATRRWASGNAQWARVSKLWKIRFGAGVEANLSAVHAVCMLRIRSPESRELSISSRENVKRVAKYIENGLLSWEGESD